MLERLIIAFFTALPPIMVAIGGLILTLRRVEAVHQIVNSQRTQMLAEIAALKEAITSRRVDDAKQEVVVATMKETAKEIAHEAVKEAKLNEPPA